MSCFRALFFAALFACSCSRTEQVSTAELDVTPRVKPVAVSVEPPGCVPSSCTEVGAQCGEVDDGCGSTLNCGTCAGIDSCQSNRCVCVPQPCPVGERMCGLVEDGCGGTVSCGTCAPGEVCGVNGFPGQCGLGPDASCDAGMWCPIRSPLPVPKLSALLSFPNGEAWALGNGALFFNGERWLTVGFLPPAVSTAWATDARDVWAVANGGALMHFDGSTWSSIDVGAAYPLSFVWGSSSSDLWVSGFEGLFHFDGVKWKHVTVPFFDRPGQLLGSSASDVWALADNRQALLHWDGVSWRRETVGTLPIYGAVITPAGLFVRFSDQTWARRDADGWHEQAGPLLTQLFTGRAGEAMAIDENSAALRWTDGGWEQWGELPYDQNLVVASGADAFWVARSGTDRIQRYHDGGLTLAAAADTGLIATAHFRGEQWAFRDGLRSAVVWSTNDFHDQAAFSGGGSGVLLNQGQRVATAGDQALFLRPISGEVLRFTGATWERFYLAEELDEGIAADSKDEVWLNGGGKVWRFPLDGGDLSQVGDLEADGLNALWPDGDGGVWATGFMNLAGGLIAHYDGQAWDAGTYGSAAITTICGSAPDDLWFGGGRTFVHWDGTALTEIAAPTGVDYISFRVDDCIPNGKGTVWVGGQGFTRVWDGGSWSPRVAAPNFTRFAGDEARKFYVGPAGRIYEYLP